MAASLLCSHLIISEWTEGLWYPVSLIRMRSHLYTVGTPLLWHPKPHHLCEGPFLNMVHVMVWDLGGSLKEGSLVQNIRELLAGAVSVQGKGGSRGV